jgi:hypothetical protein
MNLKMERRMVQRNGKAAELAWENCEREREREKKRKKETSIILKQLCPTLTSVFSPKRQRSLSYQNCLITLPSETKSAALLPKLSSPLHTSYFPFPIPLPSSLLNA